MVNTQSFSILFNPVIGTDYLWGIAAFVLLLAAVLDLRHKRFPLWRFVTAAAFFLLFLNPSFIQEQREPVPRTAFMIIDQSASNQIADRQTHVETAKSAIETAFQNHGDITLRTVTLDTPNSTNLMSTLRDSARDVAPAQRAGIVILSDGQIQDTPQALEELQDYGPVHVLLSGEKDEQDRRIVIHTAPSYGIVGQAVTMRYEVRDEPFSHGTSAPVTITVGDAAPITRKVPVNEIMEEQFIIPHAGATIIQITTPEMPDELTGINNLHTVSVNGIRDRLRVLLVSGHPYQGTRTWRNLLTADPSVDLVHFTILREPHKRDRTPQSELSLIAFPFRELFEIKLYDFDLIVLDQYRINQILPPHYFRNIVRYVQDGGALLVTSGPSYLGDRSIYQTALRDILPGTPNGPLIEQPFVPTMTELGQRHPVTRALQWAPGSATEQPWGQWLHQVPVAVKSGDILMEGAANNPLLILNRVAEGRIAQLTSDHVWLWSNGYDGGGPHAELLRRSVHWLMKEPELDERAMNAALIGETIRLRSFHPDKSTLPVTIIAPDGSETTIELQQNDNGWLEHRTQADQSGLYTFVSPDNGANSPLFPSQFLVVGQNNSVEMQKLHTTDEILKNSVRNTKGGVLWLKDTPEPDIRFQDQFGRFAGYDWIGFKGSNAFIVTGLQHVPLFSPLIALMLLLVTLIWGWWREGRS